MKTENRRPRFQRSLAVVVLAGVLLALWGVATPGTLPSGSSQPAIDSVTPESGPEGTVVTIRGANFGPPIGAVQGTSGVSFNGVGSTPMRWSDGSITVSVPAGAATGEVVVTVSGQPSAGVEFSVTGEGVLGPGIGTVSPVLGVEGTVVTIRGKGFGPAAEMGGVSFNGVWASASRWSEEEIRVAVPRDAGTGPVVVTANGQASNSVSFIVAESGLGEPAIHSLSSGMGPEGMVVTIEGENFGPAIGALEGRSGVSFNGVWGEPTSWSETQIQVTVPAGAPSGLVTVAVGGEASNGMAFVVERPAPVIEAVETALGPEGTRLQITGRNFGPAMEAIQGWSGVSIEGAWGAPVYWSGREIHVAVPEGVSSGLVVVSSGGRESNGIPFTVAGGKRMAPAPAVAASSVAPRAGPTLKSLDPTDGPVGTAVKIKGKNFGDERGTNRVTFNGTEVTNYLSWANKRIDVEVPAGATTGEVVVRIGAQATSGIEFTVTVGTDPSITMLDPDSGPEGTSVTITGVNFGATQGTGRVEFNGTAGTPTSWSDTEIVVAVPMGATTGEVVVTVDGTASAGVAFTVAPAIGSLSPASGPVGTSVEITGTSFGAVQGTSTVEFNGTEATPTNWSDTSITVTVPVGATTGDVVVTVEGEASTGVEFTVTLGISSLSPTSGPEGTSVEITGTGFGATQGTSTVDFNGTEATPTSWGDTSITVTVPMGATTGNVVVTVGGEASNGVGFTVPPAIGGLSPDRGPEGTSVEITGTSFGAVQGTSTVEFNGTAATPTNWSATSITVTVPMGATTGDVVVTVGGEASAGVSFTVTPGIGSLSPIAGPEGASVEITGTSFGAVQGTSTVEFNGTAATPTNWSDTSITVTVPAGATSGNVVVTVDGVASNGAAFAVGTDPVISSVSPSSGSSGTTVAVSGANFGATQGTSSVTFNGAAVTAYTSWSDSAITVTAPVGVGTGPVVVTVGGQVSDGVTFTVGTDPVIGSVGPTSGPVGTTVRVTGANFGAVQGTSTVAFNGVNGSPSRWSETSITVEVPSGAATGNVVVTVDSVASNGVSFTVTPAITGLSRIAGPEGVSVTITGTSFGAVQGTGTVTFNGTAVTTYSSWSDTSITVTVPAGATSGSVVVTVGGMASNGAAFTVGSDPIVSSLSPALGQVETSVEIGGANFGDTQGTGTVTFNGTAATPSNWSDTSITVTVPSTATTGPVVVTVGTAASNQVTFTVTGPPPVIGKLKPDEGGVGDSVKVKGENFGTAQGMSTVTFNGLKAAARKWDDDKITVNVPAGARTGPVVVTVDGQASNGVTFMVTGSSPSIISLDPHSGEVETSVTITGVNFGATKGTSTVTFNGVSATPTNWSDTSITAPVPATASTGPVVVTVNGQVSNGETFTVTVPAPSITGLNPTSGQVGASITISGEDFGDSRGASTVSFNGVAATAYASWNDSSIMATVPEGATTGEVVVTVGGQGSNGVSFTVEEVAVGVTVTPATLEVNEGSTGTYQVKLASEPSSDVTLTVASSDTDTVTVSSSSLTFTTGNWETAQTVTVTAEEDDDGGAEEETITHTAASTDSDYRGITIASVEVSVADNDPIGVTVTAETLAVAEGSAGTYEVKLATLPSADVTVTLESDNTDVTVSSRTLTFTTTGWNTAQTVTVEAAEDDDGASETAALTHRAASTDTDYDGIAIGSVEVSVTDNDPVGVTVTAETLDIIEGGDGAYQVRLSTLPSADVTVTPASSDTDKVTVLPATLTFTTSDWNTLQTVTVMAKEDDDFADETVRITHAAASTDTDYDGFTPIGSVEVSVDDNDLRPGVTVTASALDLTEGSTGTYEVELDTLPEATVTVTVESSDTDKVTVSSGTLTFTTGNWDIAQTVTVTAEEDDDTDNETATLTHTAASTDTNYGGITIGSVAVSVTDNDTPGVTVTPASLEVGEGSTGTYEVKLDTLPEATVTVTVTEDSDNTDVTVFPSSLTFTTANWNTFQTVTVTAKEDDDDYADETATLTHTAASTDANYNGGNVAIGSVAVDVTDNDLPPITLSSDRTSVSEPSGTDTITASVPSGYAPDADLTIALTHSGTAGHGTGADYTVGTLTIPANETSGTASLTVQDDSIDEDEETITLAGSATGYADSAALSIALEDDGDAAGIVVSTASLEVNEGATGRLQVKLNSEPLNNVTVGITETSDVSDAISVSGAPLTFTSSNWSAYQTVTVTAVEDDGDYADEEATITAGATSSDPKYNTTSLNRTVDIDVTDNDPLPITLSSVRTSVSEPSGTDTITASVPSGYAPVANLTITLTHTGTAQHGTGADYTVGTLTIPAGQTSGEATLTVRDDAIDEDEETITLTGSAAGYADSAALSIALEDDDTAGIVVSTASLNVNEGATGQFQVKLNSEPLNNVTVSIAENDNDISVSGAPLTFTSSNWNTYRTVTVTGVEDAGNFADADATITVSAASSDAKYDTASLNRTVGVNVINIHPARISLTSSEASVSEASGSRTATITATVPATAEPGSDLTIALAHLGSARHGSNKDYTVGTLTIPANRRSGTATLTVRDDRIDEGSSETITLTGSARGYRDSSNLSIPLNDDDTAGLVVSPPSLDINEGGNGQLRVRLNSQPTASVSVRVSENSSKISVSTTLTFTTSNWNTDQTATVSGTPDSDCSDQRAEVVLTASSDDTRYDDLRKPIGVDVDDDDSPTIELSSSPARVSEASGSRTATITATLGCTSSVDKRIDLAHLGSAEHGSNKDYTVGTLTIPANRRSGTATLTVRDDRIDEGSSETIEMTGGAGGYTTSSTLSIPLNDNDTAGLVASPSSLDINEGGNGQLRVRLNSQPTASVSVRVSENSSKISVSTTLTFTTSNWNTDQTATVSGTSDSDCSDQRAEGILTASSDDTRYDGLRETIDVDVDDDDSPTIRLSSNRSSVSEPNGTATITATLGCTSSIDKRINLSHLGTAKHGSNKDYTVGTLTVTRRQLTGTATLRVRDDRIDEGSSETIEMTGGAGGYTTSSTLSIPLNDNDTAGVIVSPATLTITENGSGEYEVSLNSEPTSRVTVSTSTDNDDAGRNPQSRQFTATNWSQTQEIVVRIADDDDYADETANIDNKPTSTGDPKYNRPDGLKKVVTVNIIDDDLPPLTLSCPSSVSEPSGTGTISVGVPSDHAPGSDATVTLSRVSASSTASTSDYTVEALKIKKNKTSGSATLSVTDDKIDEGTSESLTLRASASDYGSDTCTITLNDDDTRGVTVDPTSLAVDEGGTATYSVELKTQPVGGSVTVSHSESSTKISVSPSSLTFTSSNWSTSQSFTVSGEEDSGHANESATITHSATGGDYGSVTVPDVSVTVDDDEVGPPGITSIRPPLQPPDTEVTISGSNFGSSEGSVSFGSNSVTDITSWSDTSIVCFIPAFASAGTVKVKVTTSGNQTSSGYDYTITGQSPYRRGCGQEEDCSGEEKPKKGGSGGGGSEESEDPPGEGG